MKLRMLNIKEMIKDIKEDYTRDVNKIDSKYALAKLWDNYYDEEMLLYNLIIAHFNIESGEVTSGQKKCIVDILNIYDTLREDVKKSLGTEDNKILSEMLEYIESSLK